MSKSESNPNSTVLSNGKQSKIIRNTAIGLIVVLVIYLTGSYGYSVSGHYTNEDKSHSFEQSGGSQ